MENSFQNGFIKHEECIFLNIIKMQSEQKISTFPSISFSPPLFLHSLIITEDILSLSLSLSLFLMNEPESC